MKETDLINLIEDYLTAKNIFHHRNNSGAFGYTYTGKDKKSRKGFYRFGAVGAPDFVCIIRGQYIGVEAKVGKNKLSPAQMAFSEQLVKAGGRYVVVRDNIDGLIEELNHLN